MALCLAILLSNNTCKYYNAGIVRWVLSVCRFAIRMDSWNLHEDSLSENAMGAPLASAIMLLTSIVKLGLAIQSVRIVFARRNRRKRSSRLSPNGSQRPRLTREIDAVVQSPPSHTLLSTASRLHLLGSR